MSSEFKFRALTSEDWKEVNESNLIFVEGLKLKGTEKEGTYTSEPLDSGIPGCLWHRIVLDADIPENSMVTVSFITSETEVIESPSSYEKKPIVFTKAKDALIQAPPGRYIRLIIYFHREGEESPFLRQVKVYYERLSYLRYLPAIYQENSESKEFLERFLSIFESSMFDSEEMISNIPMFFDPMAAPEKFYRWLADWLSLDLYDLLEEDKKRKLILNAVEFYKKKGTVSGLASLVSVLTGKKCCIKEYKNNIFRSWGMDHWELIQDEENDTNLNIRLCDTKSDQSELDKIKCTKLYRSISKTVNTDPSELTGLLANRGKYCDEIHYVTGKSQEKDKSSRSIYYFSNSIGIFVFYPFGDKLQIDRKQLGKIIDSFLPVFVTFDIIFVETSLNESYPLSWINDEYSDQVKLSLDEGANIQYIQGEYTDKVKDWNVFFTYCKDNCPTHPANNYGRTYSKDKPEYKNYRTVHGSVGFTLYI